MTTIPLQKSLKKLRSILPETIYRQHIIALQEFVMDLCSIADDTQDVRIEKEGAICNLSDILDVM